MTVTEKISSLITAANQATSKTDADLTSAVKSLIDGYGGGTEIHSEEYTMTSEIGLSAFLASCDFQLRYRKSVIYIQHFGTNVVTQGTYTLKVIMGIHVGSTTKSHLFITRSQTNTMTFPDDVGYGVAAGELTTSYWIISSTGILGKGSNTSNQFFAAGNRVVIYELPVEDTLWGE